jgi:beta-glucosidase
VNKEEEKLLVTIKLKNTGPVKGDEVVQIYASFPESSARRPDKALKGFKRVTLEPGETKKVQISVKLDDLAYYDTEKDRFVIEPGMIKILSGASSADIQLKDQFVIEE